MKMFLGFLGRNRKPETLSQRDWDRFIHARRAGKAGPSGRPVSARTVERDLKFLLGVLNWAVKSRDEEGRLLLESNPLRGLKAPKEKNPTRVLLTQAEYEALLKVSPRVDWRFRVALVIAHETGHRIGAIRQLRWSGIDYESGIWRYHLMLRDLSVEFPLFDSRQMRFFSRSPRGGLPEPSEAVPRRVAGSS